MNAEVLNELIRQHQKDGYKRMYFQMVGNTGFCEFDLSLYTGYKFGCITFLAKRNNRNEQEYVVVDKIARFSFEINLNND